MRGFLSDSLADFMQLVAIAKPSQRLNVDDISLAAVQQGEWRHINVWADVEEGRFTAAVRGGGGVVGVVARHDGRRRDGDVGDNDDEISKVGGAVTGTSPLQPAGVRTSLRVVALRIASACDAANFAARPSARLASQHMIGALLLSTIAASPTAPLTTLSVTASAPWQSDPAVEAAALVQSLHGSTVLFWKTWSAVAPRCESSNSMRCVLDTLDEMKLPPLERDIIGVGLAARLEAPKVSAWAQLASTISADAALASWAYACGKVHKRVLNAVEVVSAGSCQDDRKGSDAVPPELDHAISDGGAPRLIAYVDPHAPSFATALSSLLAVDPKQATVILRYRPAAARGVPLVGFGASIRVKSSEYRVVDDSRSTAEGAEEEEEGEGASGGLAGDTAPSWWLRTKAGEALGGKDSWMPADDKLRELNLRASIAVLRARRPLATLRDVGGSLPALARPLSRLNISAHSGITSAIEQMYPLVKSARGALTVNGLPLDSSSLHEALEQVVNEGAAASALCALGLSPSVASRVLQLPPPAPLRVDIRGPLSDALWLQDVASDPPFADWPTDLSLLTKPVYHPPGGARFLKRNVYTALFLLDPATVDGARLGGHVATLCKKAAPLRIGIVPVSKLEGSLGPRLVEHAYIAGGRPALLALLRSLSAAASGLAGMRRLRHFRSKRCGTVLRRRLRRLVMAVAQRRRRKSQRRVQRRSQMLLRKRKAQRPPQQRLRPPLTS